MIQINNNKREILSFRKSLIKATPAEKTIIHWGLDAMTRFSGNLCDTIDETKTIVDSSKLSQETHFFPINVVLWHEMKAPLTRLTPSQWHLLKHYRSTSQPIHTYMQTVFVSPKRSTTKTTTTTTFTMHQQVTHLPDLCLLLQSCGVQDTPSPRCDHHQSLI